MPPTVSMKTAGTWVWPLQQNGVDDVAKLAAAFADTHHNSAVSEVRKAPEGGGVEQQVAGRALGHRPGAVAAGEREGDRPPAEGAADRAGHRR